jgi:hypothetical protein
VEADTPHAPSGTAANVINPTDAPSSLLDVGQWLSLHSMMVALADRSHDRTEVRLLLLDARACLEEALKFYSDAGNDLPPDEALFAPSSRARRRAHPEQFSRRRLLALASRLPRPTSADVRRSEFPESMWWRRRC